MMAAKLQEHELGAKEEEDTLKWLLDAFPTMSLEQIASTYSTNDYDADKTAHILATMLEIDKSSCSTGTESTESTISIFPPVSTSSSEEGNGDVVLKILPRRKDDDVLNMKIGKAHHSSKNSNNKKTRKPKKISVSTGTVSSFLGNGNGYSRVAPYQNNSCWLKETPGTKKIQADGMDMGSGKSMDSAHDQRHVEEFLSSMMGDDWKLEVDVVRNVLSQCGYDVEKSLNRLLEMAATSSKVHYEDLSAVVSGQSCSSEKDRRFEISFQEMSDTFPDRDQDELLTACQAAEGNIEQALSIVLEKKKPKTIGMKFECSKGQLDTEKNTIKSNLEQLKLSFPHLSESVLSEILESVDFSCSEAKTVLLEAGMEPRHAGTVQKYGMESRHARTVDKSGLPRQVLESLFNIEKSSEILPSCLDFVNAVKVERKSRKTPIKTSLDNQPEPIETEPTNGHGNIVGIVGKDDEYVVFRKIASQHWGTMRSYFQEAAAAYSSGQRARAGYLSAEGNHYKELAREADEKASQRIFDIKNRDMHNDVTIDLHSQHVKDAIRLLKLHIQSLASISSIQSLKVITGSGSHGTGRGRIKRAVTQLLEKERINWTEENTGVIVINIRDVDPDKLSFVNTDSDA